MLSFFELIAVLVLLTALFAWINHVLVGLPHAIGLLVMGMAASLILLAAELAEPGLQLTEDLAVLLRRIDFSQTVLDGMLAFLLFAGALHVDVSALRRRAAGVTLMATVGVLISTAVVGLGLWWVGRLTGHSVPLLWALVFGALISPTDAVAVLSTLKTVRVPKALELDLVGESLFNDGVSLVAFAVLVALASGTAQGGVDPLQIAEIFFVDALGGTLLGLGAGYLAYAAIRRVDNYIVEVLISLALVMATYALATRLGASGPLAVVSAGIVIGSRGAGAMSDISRQSLFAFWELIDEILNSVLFLLIGLEVLVLRFAPEFAVIVAAAVPVALLARWVAVTLPVMALHRHQQFDRGTIATLTWGGLRGGVSIALALSLPEGPEKGPILAATYAVVVFTIVVQGLTLAPLVRRATAPASGVDPA